MSDVKLPLDVEAWLAANVRASWVKNPIVDAVRHFARDLLAAMEKPAPPPLTLEVGKRYRCRDGSVVTITSFAVPNLCCDNLGYYRCTDFYDAGRRQRGVNTPLDIIEEVVDPEPSNGCQNFVECDSCRAKSGTPSLCGGCLKNRETIADLESRLAATAAVAICTNCDNPATFCDDCANYCDECENANKDEVKPLQSFRGDGVTKRDPKKIYLRKTASNWIVSTGLTEFKASCDYVELPTILPPIEPRVELRT